MSLSIELVTYVDLGGSEPERITIWRPETTLPGAWIPLLKEANIYTTVYQSYGEPAGQLVEALVKGESHLVAFEPEITEKYPQFAFNGRTRKNPYGEVCQFLRVLYVACNTYPKAIYEAL